MSGEYTLQRLFRPILHIDRHKNRDLGSRGGHWGGHLQSKSPSQLRAVSAGQLQQMSEEWYVSKHQYNKYNTLRTNTLFKLTA